MAQDRLDLLLSYTKPGAALDIAKLADVVSGMCVDDANPLTANEAGLAYDILCRLYPDAERAVRQALARRLADRTDLPRTLCLLIASDHISIGGYLIRTAPQLDDDDLIRLVVEHSQDHRLAVAERPRLSARVTDVLVYLADGDIALALASNPSAQFSEHGLTRLVNASRTQPSLQQPLLQRTDMPAALARTMYAWVGQSLKSFIRDTFGLDTEAALSEEVDAAVEDALAAQPAAPAKAKAKAEAVRTSATEDAYPESLGSLIVALRRGDLRTVEREIQKAADLASHATQRLLYNGDGKALAVVSRALGAGRSLYAEMFSRLFGTPPYNTFSRSAEFTRAMVFFDQLPAPEAETILRQWRMRPETIWGDTSRFNAAWEMRRRMDEKI